MHHKLSSAERRLIALWLKEDLGVREMARRLRRSHSTVSRELVRNRFKGETYEPLHAQALANKRKCKSWEAKQPLKNKDVYAYVTDKLREGWSPEVISGRLKEVDHPGEPHWRICPETIYRFIYHPQNKHLAWWEYLRRKQKRRREKGGRKVHRIRIPDRVSIHTRPRVVDKRKQPGHWEGDSIVGLGHRTGLHTEYERVTSFTKIRKLNRLDSPTTLRAQRIIFRTLPKKLRRTTTLDNGSEMAKHRELQNELGIKVYFADPYSAWQRGGNENANMWIRYYFPKKTDFAKISDEEIADVERELNNRPRKRLNYRTPLEVLESYLVQS